MLRLDPELFGGYVPTFVPCATCGTETTISPCWDCQRAEETKREQATAEARKGLPERFAWATLEAPEMLARVHVVGRSGQRVSVADAARHVLAHRGPAVTFLGPAGSGKTSFAVACLRTVPGPMYVAAATLERARIEHRAGEGESPLVRRALSARVLLIDDLGQDKPSSVSAVEAVILARHDASAATWVTSGLSPDEIANRYGEGVRRRLTEPGTGLVIGFRRTA